LEDEKKKLIYLITEHINIYENTHFMHIITICVLLSNQ
jgi:hypothetical protein